MEFMVTYFQNTNEESLLVKYKLSTLEDVKSRWTSLRDYFRQLVNSLKKSGAASSGILNIASTMSLKCYS